MSGIFTEQYADAYDLIYSDKDYLAECDLLEAIFKQYGTKRIQRILDLGCGTGNHALPLAERGYLLTGIDRSPSMLVRARLKATELLKSSNVNFVEGDVRSVRLESSFDAVLMMFAVLGYQLANDDVLAALTTARSHLREQGIFIFDVWYGPAVLTHRPSQKIKIVSTAKGKTLRAASGTLAVNRHVCAVHYDLWKIGDDRLVEETTETHEMRYFFPLELEQFLQDAGFALLRLGEFPNIQRDPDESSWNVIGVAQAL